MRTPTVVNVHPPASLHRWSEAGLLDEGDMFLGNATVDPELFIVVEKPRTGLLQIMSLETGNKQPLSRDSMIQQVTAVVTVLGDVQIA